MQMLQLFNNLIGNALKYTKAGVKPIIKIAVAPLTDNEKALFPKLASNQLYHNIEISDNGIGINSEYTSSVFNLFQRLHGKKEYSGNGIGLSMCKKITNNHNGEIHALNSSEHGAVFNVILPQNQMLQAVG